MRKKPSRADLREQRTGMRQPLGVMILKIALGLLFLAVSLEDGEEGWTLSYFFVCLVLGLSLIAWGLLPWLQGRKQKAEEARLLAAEKTAEAERPRICRACGAPGQGRVCAYCGTPYDPPD